MQGFCTIQNHFILFFNNRYLSNYVQNTFCIRICYFFLSNRFVCLWADIISWLGFSFSLLLFRLIALLSSFFSFLSRFSVNSSIPTLLSSSSSPLPPTQTHKNGILRVRERKKRGKTYSMSRLYILHVKENISPRNIIPRKFHQKFVPTVLNSVKSTQTWLSFSICPLAIRLLCCTMRYSTVCSSQTNT